MEQLQLTSFIKCKRQPRWMHFIKEVSGLKGFKTKTITEDGAQRALYLKKTRGHALHPMIL
jgi:hypothetical protein